MSVAGVAAAPDVSIEVATMGPPPPASALADLAAGVRRGIERVRAELNMPFGLATVTVDAGRSTDTELFVNGRHVLYPSQLVAEAAHVVTGKHETLARSAAEVWATIVHDESYDGSSVARFGELFSRAVLATRPSALLDPAIGAVLRALWQAPAPWTSEEVTTLAARIVDLGLALPDADRMNALLLRRASPPGQTVLDFAEEVVNEIRVRHLELRLSVDLFRPVLTEMETRDEPLLASTRDRLFVELGIDTSPLNLRPDESLPAGTFVTRVNDLDLLPHVAVPEGEVLVNETADRLALSSIDARPTSNPATWLPGAIAPALTRPQLESEGCTVWDRAEHIALAFAHDVRSNAWRLLDAKSVSSHMDPMTTASPRTTRALDAAVGRVTFTRVLRALLAEGLPIRDFVGIADRLVVAGAARGSYSDIPGLVEGIRAGLRWRVSRVVSRGSDTVVCYLVDADLERRVATAPETDTEPRDELCRALATEIAHLPRFVTVPCLVVAPEHRLAVHTALGAQFPRVPVVSWAELVPSINLQPIARLLP